MTTNFLTIAHQCDYLTRNGDKLSVTWNGGHDSGYFQLCMNDEEVAAEETYTEWIISKVEDELGYGSFAGDYTTEGELIYNPETKCFEGHDEYQWSENAIWLCKIPVVIPSAIWFDQVTIHLESEYNFGGSVNIRLIVNNGPVTDAHTAWEEHYSEILQKLFNTEIHQIEKFDGVLDDIELERSDFSTQGDHLVAHLRQFEYGTWNSDYKQISVSITS